MFRESGLQWMSSERGLNSGQLGLQGRAGGLNGAGGRTQWAERAPAYVAHSRCCNLVWRRSGVKVRSQKAFCPFTHLTDELHGGALGCHAGSGWAGFRSGGLRECQLTRPKREQCFQSTPNRTNFPTFFWCFATIYRWAPPDENPSPSLRNSITRRRRYFFSRNCMEIHGTRTKTSRSCP